MNHHPGQDKDRPMRLNEFVECPLSSTMDVGWDAKSKVRPTGHMSFGFRRTMPLKVSSAVSKTKHARCFAASFFDVVND
jgi:hypothetical protein